MNKLGNGIYATGVLSLATGHYEDALSVREAELSMLRRLGAGELNILLTQSNLASTYDALGRHQDAMRMSRDVYFGRLKLLGQEHRESLIAALNYASSLVQTERFEEARSLLREYMPVARRILGAGHDHTLRMRTIYASTFSLDANATLDDLREAKTTFEETRRTAQRLLGGAHPIVAAIDIELEVARAALRTRETPSPGIA